MFTVGTDAADASGKVEDDVRAGFGEQLPDRVYISQVIRRTAWNDNRGRLTPLELFDHKRAKESGTARHQHALAAPYVTACRPVRCHNHAPANQIVDRLRCPLDEYMRGWP